MSSTNSRLNPPSTIRVGDNNNDTSINDEGKNEFSTQHVHATSSSTISSPDIDRVIQGFQNELDSLSRSFDRIAASRSMKSSSTTQNRHKPSVSTPKVSTSTPAPPPPPPPVTQVEVETESKSTQKSRFAADETFATSSRYEEPRPVETPVPSGSTTTTGYSDYHRRRRYTDIGSSDHNVNLFPNHTEKRLEARIEAMNEIMKEQSATIVRLQRENNELRRKLSMPPKQQSFRDPLFERNQSRTPTTSRVRNSEYNNSYNNHYDDHEMKPTVSSLTTIPRDDDDDENTLETAPHRAGFTPGTKFVAVSRLLLICFARFWILVVGFVSP